MDELTPRRCHVFDNGISETVYIPPFPGARKEHAEKFGNYTMPPVFVTETDGLFADGSFTHWIRGNGGIVIDMTGKWANNYFHWVSEFLPMIQIADSIYVDYQIITNTITAGFAKQSLELLGFHQEKKLTAGMKATIAKIPPRRSEGRMSVQAVKWLRNQFLTNKQHEGRRLYISRPPSLERHVKDELILIDGLGFEVVKPDLMTFREQIDLFSSAETIAGPHGAGLVNMIWMDSGEVIEMLGSMTNPCHFTMAVASGHKYTPVYGKTSGRSIIIDRCFAVIEGKS